MSFRFYCLPLGTYLLSAVIILIIEGKGKVDRCPLTEFYFAYRKKIITKLFQEFLFYFKNLIIIFIYQILVYISFTNRINTIILEFGTFGYIIIRDLLSKLLIIFIL